MNILAPDGLLLLDNQTPAKPKKAGKKKKPAKRPAKKVKAAASSERMDLRVPKHLKVKVYAKAKKLRRTVTSIIVELIDNMK